MTVHEEWTDQLSDYLDGELPADDRGAVEAHLRSCAPCAAVLNDLKRVVARAQTVHARLPHADMWAGIADRIEAGRPAAEPGLVMPFSWRGARRFAFTLPQLAAAAALLMAVSGGIAWEVAARSPEGLRHTTSAPETASGREVAQGFGQDVAQGFGRDVAQGFSPASETDPTAADRIVPISLADAQYDAAVADLEQALKAGRGRLDASTIAIVEHNLQIIDQAINQAREALVTDPANSYLSSHLVEARRRKLDLLRRATALATEAN
jgi:hypothetical protein